MSFLMVFKLKTKSFSKNFGIVLPGPSDPGIKIYENINNIFSKGNGIKLGLKHIIDRDFFSSESLTFASHVYWQIYKKRNYYS